MQKQTFCSKCNARLENDARFCTECGTEVQTLPETVYDTIYCIECGTKTTTEFTFCTQCGKPLPKVEAGVSKDEGEGILGKKKINLPPFKWTHVGIAAAAVLLVLIFIAIFSSGGSKLANHMIYVKDKQLQYTYVSKMDTFEMTDKLNSGYYNWDAYDYMSLYQYILMSEDSRFIYYPDRIDDYPTYYWRDLKANNNKDEAAVKIDSEIEDVPFLTKDGSKLFYIKGNDSRLYIYDRKTDEKVKLDNDVSSFYVNEKGDYLIYNKYLDGEYSIYEMEIKNLSGEKTKLDSNAKIYKAYANDRKVYYLKEDTLYVKEYKKDKEKIASDVKRVVSIVGDSSVYYLKAEEVTEKLSNFIYDDMAADDRTITEAIVPPAPEYPRESDYLHKVWYSYYWGDEIHPETNERGFWDEEVDWEAYDTALDQYWEKYDEWENAQLIYDQKLFRDELRKELDREENAVAFDRYSLYYWNNGTETLVASDLAEGDYGRCYITASSETPVVLYQKNNNSDSGKLKLSGLLEDWGNYYYIEDIIYDMEDRVFSSQSISEDIFVAYGEKESILECDKARKWSIDEKGTIYFLDDYYYEKGYGTLMSANFSDGVVNKPVKIDEDVSDFRHGNEPGKIYYFKDVKNMSGDMYLNGKVIVSDIYIPSLYIYKDTNTLLYYTDYSEKNLNGTLCMFKGGKQTKISDDVSFYTPIDKKKIAYLTDYNFNRERGDLMLFDGRKAISVDSSVTILLWNKNMIWGDDSSISFLLSDPYYLW
ncbi:MAG: zinc-ribbon domain-containing protein [Clostridiaceae bacterium]|nr:zinc-ribbon domain-containing protein [Clostridiaceae bacterium]